MMDDADTVCTEDDDAVMAADIPVDGGEFRSSMMASGAAASLPSAEEIRGTVVGRGSSRRGGVKNKKKWLWVALSLALLGIIIGVSIAIGKKSNDADSASRKVDFQSVSQYMINQGVSDPDDFLDHDSPQTQAAEWLAYYDRANLPLPDLDITQIQGYRYVFRYVMALNYYMMGGETWNFPLNWMSSRDICEWQGLIIAAPGAAFRGGIFCEAKTRLPVYLYLFFNNLDGRIPSENGRLITLLNFNLGHNQLIGSIPTELCQLESLWSLFLVSNSLSGEIPACINNIQSLQRLFINDNLLSGHLPVSMADLRELERVSLDDNLFTGDPTPIFNSLTELTFLMGNNNNFTGTIDQDFLRAHRKLEWVDLSGNQFTSDGLPSHLFSMRGLDVLDLSMNQLAGHIPSELEVNSVLTYLSLYGNKLDGPLPESLKNLTRLEHLDVSQNKFHGPIRAEIAELQYLKFLFLSENPGFYAGGIPVEFANMTKLEDLSLRNTNRTGQLPEFIGSMTKLELLDLSGNKFHGPVPASYGNLTDLEYLLLNNNLITEQLPESLSRLTKLRAAFLDGTNLEGSVDVLCEVPGLKDEAGSEILYADCGGNEPEVTCTCCKEETCCPGGEESGCSRPGMANLDGSWETQFRRVRYVFSNQTSFIDSDFVPPP